jgi:hypothetical protein
MTASSRASGETPFFVSGSDLLAAPDALQILLGVVAA